MVLRTTAEDGLKPETVSAEPKSQATRGLFFRAALLIFQVPAGAAARIPSRAVYYTFAIITPVLQSR